MLDMDDYSPRAAEPLPPNEEEDKPDALANPTAPPDYGLEMPQMVPRLVKWLMHRRVTKIASGGVHNICVVEPSPQSTVAQDVYLMNFVQARFTDVVFKGFYTTAAEPETAISSS
jgi:hypothetical protein